MKKFYAKFSSTDEKPLLPDDCYFGVVDEEDTGNSYIWDWLNHIWVQDLTEKENE